MNTTTQEQFFQALEEKNVATVQAMLDGDAGLLQARNQDGFTPLHTAVSRSCPELIDLLVSRGAEVDAREDGWGQTPLGFAVFNCDLPVVSCLLGHGAEWRKGYVDMVDKGLQGEWDETCRQYGGVHLKQEYQAMKDLLLTHSNTEN